MEHIRFVWPRFPPLGFRFGTTVTSRSRIEAGCANNPDSTDGESPRERERERAREKERLRRRKDGEQNDPAWWLAGKPKYDRVVLKNGKRRN